MEALGEWGSVGDFNEQTKDYQTPLHRAAAGGHAGAVRALIAQQADANTEARTHILFAQLTFLRQNPIGTCMVP